MTMVLSKRDTKSTDLDSYVREFYRTQYIAMPAEKARQADLDSLIFTSPVPVIPAVSINSCSALICYNMALDTAWQSCTLTVLK